jgi:hypothetical protein
MGKSDFVEILGAAKIADESGLICEKSVVMYGTMNEGGSFKLEDRENKLSVSVELIEAEGGWKFLPSNFIMPVDGVDPKKFSQFMIGVSAIVGAITGFINS